LSAERHQSEEFTIFLHSDAFVKLLGEETVRTGLPSLSTWKKEFQWSEYCQYARMSELKPRSNFVCFVYGQRYLDYEEHPYGNRIHIWDFNPYIIKRRRYLVQNQAGEKPKKEIFNEGVMQWNTVSDGGETAHYSAPANDDRYTPNTRSPTEKRPMGSTASKWALTPVYDTEASVVENPVFKEKKVWSSLPFRRVTSRSKLANLSGAMMDDERIVLIKTNREEMCLEIAVMSIVQELSHKDRSDIEPDLSGLLYHLSPDDTL